MSASLRHFDLITLRSFVTIAETASMTHAAARLFLTQSAISMQIKRLESSLGLSVFERTPQGMIPTSAGDQLLYYAKQMLEINDEAIGRLTSPNFEGQIRLGVTDDIIFPRLPIILKKFSREYPRIKVLLTVELTRELKKQFTNGLQDLIITTEETAGEDGAVLAKSKLSWTGAENGNAWRERPLPVSLTRKCSFRTTVTDALHDVSMPWIDIVSPDNEAVVEAMTSSDFCVSVELESTVKTGRTNIDHKGQLPDLPVYSIILYSHGHTTNKLANIMSDYLKSGYALKPFK